MASLSPHRSARKLSECLCLWVLIWTVAILVSEDGSPGNEADNLTQSIYCQVVSSPDPSGHETSCQARYELSLVPRPDFSRPPSGHETSINY